MVEQINGLLARKQKIIEPSEYSRYEEMAGFEILHELDSRIAPIGRIQFKNANSNEFILGSLIRGATTYLDAIDSVRNIISKWEEGTVKVTSGLTQKVVLIPGVAETKRVKLSQDMATPRLRDWQIILLAKSIETLFRQRKIVVAAAYHFRIGLLKDTQQTESVAKEIKKLHDQLLKVDKNLRVSMLRLIDIVHVQLRKYSKS
jgi:hypothetical protein